MPDEQLKLKFLGSLVEQLGAQLYPSATATVAELISNAWDADAKNVWVTIPFGEEWRPESAIRVLDDGHGMTREEVQSRYLVVGRKRRVEQGNDVSEGGRPLHGRKGIGKLAAFGTAQILECYTIRDGNIVSFRLDYDKIRREQPGSDHEVEEAEFQEELQSPSGEPLTHGTRIYLTRLRLRRATPEDRFLRSMSRRFALDETEMRVFVNGVQLQRFDMDLQIRFPRDAKPNGVDVTVDEDGWADEAISSGKRVKWWIGFTEKPLEADYLKGISIIARGKMLQRPFMFERSRGAWGQLGQEYIVGEVRADWLDTGEDIEDDLIQTNRDQLQLEDDRVQELLQWGRSRLDWALASRAEIRRESSVRTLEEPDIAALTEEFTPKEKQVLVDIAKKAAQIGDPSPEEVRDFMVEVVNGYKDKAVRQLMEQVRIEDEPFQDRFWSLVREFSLIDARKNLSIIQARLETIERLAGAIRAGATEVPEIHGIVKEYPWLLDPRWSLLGDEINVDELSEPYTPLVDDETGDILDFLFILRPKPPAPPDQVLVVEIKRGFKSNGNKHSVTDSEVNKFHSYVLGVREHYARNTNPPAVSGLMIANFYSARANRLRKSLENLQEVRLEFRTWESVIDNTRLLHTSWLEVSRMGSNPASSG